MSAILADDNFKCIFLNENDRISIWISLKFVLRSPFGNKPALVQVMAWRRTGDKPLPELILTQFTDIYAALGWDELSLRGNSSHRCEMVVPVRTSWLCDIWPCYEQRDLYLCTACLSSNMALIRPLQHIHIMQTKDPFCHPRPWSLHVI